MKQHTKKERLIFLNERETSGKTANKQTQSFLPVKIVSEKNTDKESDPCLIKIGDIFTIKCSATTSRRAIEIVLPAAVKTCGQMIVR
ncbi:MAG TPA: hypothetical protein VJ861_11675 [Treponemataceae bacterium]|nr:hypothetical protein [Treponemataceae bacterium]